ncbi:hypothetical protein IC575_017410 [Cucumis melo]
MNFFNPFSPPGNPPVKPINSFSNPSSGTLSTGNFVEVSGISFPSAMTGLSSTFLLSSSSTPRSPLQRPLPPRSWAKSKAAEGRKA